MLSCALAATATAGAAPPGSTLWVSVPSGFGPFPAQDVNESAGFYNNVDRPDSIGASADGRFVAFASQSDGLSDVDDDRLNGVFLRDRVAQTTTLISRVSGAAGAAANGDSYSPTISDDGRYVAFASRATNLAPEDLDTRVDVYVRDRQTETTTLLTQTLGPFGTKSNGDSSEPVISGDGSAVAFATSATNLDGLLGPDGGTDSDVYRRTLSGSMTLVSRIGGGMKANGESYEPSISDDGNRIAYASTATNLDPADAGAETSVYRYDIGAATATLISRQSAADGGAVADSYTEEPSISGNGDAIAFRTLSTNLDGAGGPDTTGSADIYVRRVSTAVTTLASRATGAAGAIAGASSQTPAINNAGTRVAFNSEASNLGFTGPPGTETAALFERDLAGTTTTLLSTGPGGPEGMFGGHVEYAGASTAVVFATGGAPGLSPDQNGLTTQVFFRGPPADPELVSRPGGAGTNAIARFVGAYGSFVPGARQISEDGRYVVFQTVSPGILSAGAAVIRQSIARRDLLTGETVLVSRASGVDGAPANAFAQDPTISADGNRVAFDSAASNLDLVDTVGQNDVFVRDMAVATTSLISRADGPAGVASNGGSFTPRISADGRSVVFVSGATNLVTGDTNARSDAFVRGIDAGTTTLVSRADGTAGALANAGASKADISGDGRLAVFETTSSNLGDGDADIEPDIFVRDLAAGATRLVSRADGDGAKATAVAPAISSDGRIVGFESSATSLGLPAAAPTQVFLRDLGARTTRLVSSTPGGPPADKDSGFAGLSSDGSSVLFASSATNLGVPAVDFTNRLFLRRLPDGAPQAISRKDGVNGALLDASALAASISGDGSCAVFTSRGDPALPGISPDFYAVYVRVLSSECPKTPPATTTTTPAPADTVAPKILAFSFVPKSFRVGPGRTAVSAAKPKPKKKKVRTGTAITLRATEPGTVRIALVRLLPGRRVGTSCRKPARKLRKRKACTRAVAQGTLTRRAKGTTTKIAFTGRVGRRRLAAGKHRASATVTDAAGNRSAARTVSFTVRSR